MSIGLLALIHISLAALVAFIQQAHHCHLPRQLSYLHVIASMSTGLLSLIHISLAALVTLYTANTLLPSTLTVIIPVRHSFYTYWSTLSDTYISGCFGNIIYSNTLLPSTLTVIIPVCHCFDKYWSTLSDTYISGCFCNIIYSKHIIAIYPDSYHTCMSLLL